jgi:hypothetical protein
MAEIEISASQVGAALRSTDARIRKGVMNGLRVAAQRGRTVLVSRSPVDMGQFKGAWKVEKTLEGADVVNDAPHAGIIERGARPHAVSDVGVLAIEDWVRRHFHEQTRSVARQRKNYGSRAKYGKKSTRTTAALEQQYVHELAMKIVWKLRTKGQEPKWVVRDALPALSSWLDEEIKRALHLVSAGKGGDL